jgi:hypothetical protein
LNPPFDVDRKISVESLDVTGVSSQNESKGRTAILDGLRKGFARLRRSFAEEGHGWHTGGSQAEEVATVASRDQTTRARRGGGAAIGLAERARAEQGNGAV